MVAVGVAVESVERLQMVKMVRPTRELAAAAVVILIRIREEVRLEVAVLALWWCGISALSWQTGGTRLKRDRWARPVTPYTVLPRRGVRILPS